MNINLLCVARNFVILFLNPSFLLQVILGDWETLPMFTLQKALIQEKIASASTIKVLDRASVPIVKFTEQSTNVKVRILSDLDLL